MFPLYPLYNTEVGVVSIILGKKIRPFGRKICAIYTKNRAKKHPKKIKGYFRVKKGCRKG